MFRVLVMLFVDLVEYTQYKLILCCLYITPNRLSIAEKRIICPLLLTIINKRIEKLLDRDHQIGHSYLMSVRNLADLKAVFQNKILPLLQEYFFGDYSKIGLVTGKGFFEDIEEETEEVFADFDYDASRLSDKPVYKLKDITVLGDEEFIQAINQLLRKS